jgi:hypothetical protein
MTKKVALLVVPVLALGCGGDAPTTPTPRAISIEIVSVSTVPAHAASFVGFRQEASGEASAGVSVSPGPVPIEMGVGSCDGARSVIARSDQGAVTATLPVGDCFVRFENTGDVSAIYRLTLRYLTLH